MEKEGEAAGPSEEAGLDGEAAGEVEVGTADASGVLPLGGAGDAGTGFTVVLGADPAPGDTDGVAPGAVDGETLDVDSFPGDC